MRIRKVVAALAVFGLLAAACSDDDDDGQVSTDPPTTEAAVEEESGTEDSAPSTDAVTDDTTAPGGTEAPAGTDAPADSIAPEDVVVSGQGVDDDTVLIGMSIDQSGVAAPISKDIIKSLEARFAVANDDGGIAGRQIEMIVLDDKGDPTQALSNFRQLWEKDKVFAMYTLGSGAPLEYIDQQQVPTFVLGGTAEAFSSTYPTILPLGSLTPTWAAQTAYSLSEYADIHPKKVAVLYNPDLEALNPFIENYWTELGVEEVIFDPPPADCSALVLKYQDAGVDYWDFQDFGFIGCVFAEQTLGWEPPMGQGGAIASTLAITRVVGEPMYGGIAGSPNRLADGRPTYDEPTEAHQAYLDGMAEYAPELYADTPALNDAMTVLAWVAGNFIVEDIDGIAAAGEISQEAALEWAWAIEDWDSGLAGVIHSASPDCKTGNDASIWGYWVDDGNGDFVVDPFVPDLIDNSWLGLDECYLTALADEVTS